MENITIADLKSANLDPQTLHKIKAQANYVGLQNNYSEGDTVNVLLNGKIYQTHFYRNEALELNSPPTCSTTSIFLQSYPISSIAEGKEKLADLISLKEPVSETVFFAVVNDHNYFHNLMICKDVPEMLSYLLSNPPALEKLTDGTEDISEKTTMQLMSKVAKSMIEWSKTGFSKVDDLTYRQRIKTCTSCRFLKDPPQSLAYKFATLTKKERFEKKICALCGCVISNKAKLPHETCPLNHPTLEGKNMWD